MRTRPTTTGTGFRFTGRSVTEDPATSPEPTQRAEERPVRAGGRGVGKCEDGGPDRIRTGDLQRDRLACWAATPRVRLRRGRTIAEASRPVVPCDTRRPCPTTPTT